MILQMKKTNYEMFYQRVRCLFPSIGIKEGRFLKELRYHLQDFSFSHPNAGYEEITAFFGTPEEIVKNYIESEGIENVVKRFTVRKYLRFFISGIFLLFFFLWVAYFIFWIKSYQAFTAEIPAYGEVTLEEGIVEP